MFKRKTFFDIKRLFSFLLNGDSRKTSRQKDGALAEDEAAQLLKRKGYKILIRNWVSGRDEIDIIAEYQDVLIFVEVRARSVNALVSGYHSVDTRKKNAMRRASKAYLRALNKPPKHFRWDIIEVKLGVKPKIVSINHYENVSLFAKHFLTS